MFVSIVSARGATAAAGSGAGAASVGSIGLIVALSLLTIGVLCALAAWRSAASVAGTPPAGPNALSSRRWFARIAGRAPAASASRRPAVRTHVPPHWPLPGAEWTQLLQRGPVMFLSFELASPHVVHDASPALASLTGSAALGGLAGRPLLSIVHPDDAARTLRALAAAQPDASAPPSGAPAQGVELRVLQSNGSTSWWRLDFDATGAATGGLVEAVLIDISTLKLARLRVRKQKRQTHVALERLARLEKLMQETQALSQRLSVCDDTRSGYRLIGESVRRLFPSSFGSLVLDDGSGVSWPVAHWPSNVAVVALAASRSDAPDVLAPPRLVHGRLADLPLGGEGMVEVGFPAGGRPESHAAAQRDVDAFADALQPVLAHFQARLALRDQALRDGLTGLYNRRHFDLALEQEVNRSTRSAAGFTLALIDIDHFKSFNDAFGHDAGDTVLKAVAAQVIAFVRSYDVACRVGGEELALLLPDAAIDEACGRLELLRERIAGIELMYDGRQLPAVTVSIGAADSRMVGAASPLRCADAALYAAKRDGRNRVARWQTDWELSSSFGALRPFVAATPPPDAAVGACCDETSGT